MKKILLLVALSAGLMANPYIGVGGTLTDKQEDCRAYVLGLAGYQVNDKFAAELRYSHIMRGDTQDIGIYSKMGAPDSFYGLVGFKKSLNAIHCYDGFDFGLGYAINKTSIEAVYSQAIEAPMLNIVFRF